MIRTRSILFRYTSGKKKKEKKRKGKLIQKIKYGKRSIANWVFKEDLQKLNASWTEFEMKCQKIFEALHVIMKFLKFEVFFGSLNLQFLYI